MSGVRVLRLLEYTYPNQETADLDMAQWGVPPIGAHKGASRRLPGHATLDSHADYMIRSAIIQQPIFAEEPADADN
jgi:hypothetical protein